MVERTTKPRMSAGLPFPFCTQTVDDPAIGIDAMIAKPTRTFWTSSALCQNSFPIPANNNVKRRGIITFEIKPISRGLGVNRIHLKFETLTDIPAFKRRNESIISGSEKTSSPEELQFTFP